MFVAVPVLSLSLFGAWMVLGSLQVLAPETGCQACKLLGRKINHGSVDGGIALVKPAWLLNLIVGKDFDRGLDSTFRMKPLVRVEMVVPVPILLHEVFKSVVSSLWYYVAVCGREPPLSCSRTWWKGHFWS